MCECSINRVLININRPSLMSEENKKIIIQNLFSSSYCEK